MYVIYGYPKLPGFDSVKLVEENKNVAHQRKEALRREGYRTRVIVVGYLQATRVSSAKIRAGYNDH